MFERYVDDGRVGTRRADASISKPLSSSSFPLLTGDWHCTRDITSSKRGEVPSIDWSASERTDRAGEDNTRGGIADFFGVVVSSLGDVVERLKCEAEDIALVDGAVTYFEPNESRLGEEEVVVSDDSKTENSDCDQLLRSLSISTCSDSLGAFGGGRVTGEGGGDTSDKRDISFSVRDGVDKCNLNGDELGGVARRGCSLPEGCMYWLAVVVKPSGRTSSSSPYEWPVAL